MRFTERKKSVSRKESPAAAVNALRAMRQRSAKA
jgi:hypothetical protein